MKSEQRAEVRSLVLLLSINPDPDPDPQAQVVYWSGAGNAGRKWLGDTGKGDNS